MMKLSIGSALIISYKTEVISGESKELFLSLSMSSENCLVNGNASWDNLQTRFCD